MDCTRFEDLLFESLDGSLAAADELGMQAHQLDCARCRELAALMRGDTDDASATPIDLVAGVLERTSGSSRTRSSRPGTRRWMTTAREAVSGCSSTGSGSRTSQPAVSTATAPELVTTSTHRSPRAAVGEAARISLTRLTL